jgi:hypothetical protein
VELNTEEDFLSCQQYEKETLSDFFRMFLCLKAQAPEVMDEKVITQAIKALRVGQLHSHLVREHPKTLEELYDDFQKFSRSEVLHFCKLDQQRKVPKESESSRPTKYIKSKENTMSFDTSHKQVHSIDSDGCGPPENWEKNYEPPQLENRSRAFDSRTEYHNPRGGYTNCLRKGRRLSALKLSKPISRWWGRRLRLSSLHVDQGLLHGLKHLCLHNQHLLKSRRRGWWWVDILVVLLIIVPVVVVVVVSCVGYLKYKC